METGLLRTLNKVKVSLGVLAVLYLAACAPVQRPLKNGQGYVVLPISEKQFRIEYYSKTAPLAESYWNITAGQLCPDGFQIIYSKRHTLNFDMYVPIAGNDVNLGRQEFIQYGQVICEGAASTALTLTDSKWREFNQESRSITPLSDRWIRETLKINPSYLLELPSKNSVAALEKQWGKHRQQIERNNERMTTWVMSGTGWLPNQVELLERNNCLKLIMILPGVTNVWLNIMEKSSMQKQSLESLIITGVLPTYFYQPNLNC